MSSVCDCKSSNISLKLPKHAKPAFFVLAPCGNTPLSKIRTFDLGNRCFNCKAHVKPTMPLPTIVKSIFVSQLFISQYDKFKDNRINDISKNTDFASRRERLPLFCFQQRKGNSLTTLSNSAIKKIPNDIRDFFYLIFCFWLFDNKIFHKLGRIIPCQIIRIVHELPMERDRGFYPFNNKLV